LTFDESEFHMDVIFASCRIGDAVALAASRKLLFLLVFLIAPACTVGNCGEQGDVRMSGVGREYVSIEYRWPLSSSKIILSRENDSRRFTKVDYKSGVIVGDELRVGVSPYWEIDALDVEELNAAGFEEQVDGSWTVGKEGVYGAVIRKLDGEVYFQVFVKESGRQGLAIKVTIGSEALILPSSEAGLRDRFGQPNFTYGTDVKP